MPSIKKRGNSFRCTVDFKKIRDSKTFKDKRSAEMWGAKRESEILNGINGTMDRLRTFEDLLTEYQKNITPTKEATTQRWENIRHPIFKQLPLAKLYLKDLNTTHFVEWRDERLKTVMGSTVNREINLLSGVLTYGIKEKQWIKINPLSSMRRPKNPKSRSRRPSKDEIERLSIALDYSDDKDVVTNSQMTGLLMHLAIETAMRKAEMITLEWPDVFDKYVHLDITKNGSERDVPLSKKARFLINKMKGFNGRKVFPLSISSLDAYWLKARNECNIVDLHFHDTRREATTRLSKKVDVLTLAKITGHKDVNTLMNIYYKPEPDSIADLLG